MRIEDVLAASGRLLLAGVFLAAAFLKIVHFEAATRTIEAHGLPLAPLLCAASAALEVLGGLALALGYGARLGAGVLAASLLGATLIFYPAPGQRLPRLKNLAILGGLLQVVAFGPGPIALEDRPRLR